MKTLQQILGVENMLATIQAVKSGIPIIFDPGFLTQTVGTEGDTGTYIKVEGGRKTAQQAMYGAPSKRVNLTGVKDVAVKLIHQHENQLHKPTTLLNLSSETSEARQRLGIETISRQTKDFKARGTNLRISAVSSMLALGAVHFDGDGNLLSSSTGAKISIDYGIPAGNKNQLNWDGNGAIIAADWDTATTKIITHVEDLLAAAIKLTGYPITTAYYGKNVPGFLTKNNDTLNYASQVPAMASAIATGTIPDGLLGIQKWRPANQQFFVDQNGDIKEMFDDDSITFTPELDMTWYEMIEGTYPVPTNLGAVTADAVAQINANVMEARGMFGYAKLVDDPVTVEQHAGDTFLPVLKVPKAVFIAKVSGF